MFQRNRPATRRAGVLRPEPSALRPPRGPGWPTLDGADGAHPGSAGLCPMRHPASGHVYPTAHLGDLGPPPGGRSQVDCRPARPPILQSTQRYAHVNLEELREVALPWPKNNDETDHAFQGGRVSGPPPSAGFPAQERRAPPSGVARYADALGHRGPLTTRLALDWACRPRRRSPLLGPAPGDRSYLRQASAADRTRTQIPPRHLLGPAIVVDPHTSRAPHKSSICCVAPVSCGAGFALTPGRPSSVCWPAPGCASPRRCGWNSTMWIGTSPY